MDQNPQESLENTINTVGTLLLGCPRKLGSMVGINGLFHLITYKWGIPWGYNSPADPITFDSSTKV